MKRRPTMRDTSLDAWLAHETHAVDAKILRFLRSRHAYGATDAEIEAALQLRHEVVSGDRRHMVERHEVHDSGLKRPTPRGRAAIVWRFGPQPVATPDHEGQWGLSL